MAKKVGIVIPSYNQIKYLEIAIKSVLENKRHADIEVVVIDGGSTDGSTDIIQKYETELKMWCSESDGGQANAINKGIAALSECDYYMWLNSDDVYEDEYSIQKLVDYMDEQQLDVCYGLSHFVDQCGEIIGEYPVEEFGYKKLGNRCFLSQPSVMFSRKAYEETGPINESLKMCLDYEYWMRLAQRYSFGFLREYIGNTRIYNETKTATMQQKHLEEAFSILKIYYGKIPMHWVVTKYLYEHPDSVLQKFPRRILMLLLLPYKWKIIR
ncbi:MAG: glycosyltransferase [bacterium]|nr:glycosyltransferase [bacterium]MCM1374850.1 glycosyltransferase [Muribaculum sp.]